MDSTKNALLTHTKCHPCIPEGGREGGKKGGREGGREEVRRKGRRKGGQERKKREK